MSIVSSPLFLDPIYNGAADPMIIKNEQDGKYYMFYTQRRAFAKIPDSVSYCYGSKIGVAQANEDGSYWFYRGTLELEFEFGDNTFWAPEIVWDDNKNLYHMYVSYICGIHSKWYGESCIMHYTSSDLLSWNRVGQIKLNSDRVIDPCIFKLDNGIYRMWYKDGATSYTCYADSDDLYNWEYKGICTDDCCQEGPNVFEFGGKYWLIADEWNGLSVYYSDDLTHFTRQNSERLLTGNGSRNLDRGVGRHADVITQNGRAFIVYFTHYNDDENIESEDNHEFTAVQLAELEIINGKLCCNRDKEVEINFG